MPVSYRIDADRRLISSTFEGVVGDEDLLGLRRRILADPLFRPDYDHLMDATGVTRLAMSTDGVRSLTAADPFVGDARRALVVGNDAAYGMGRMFQNRTERGPEHMLVTRDMDEAREWLGLDP